MSALGEAFRTAREARGLTVSDVAEHIHIRSVYLAAIEAEAWASIGAPVYVRGFIRTYARFLGLDADDAVSRFSSMTPGESPMAAASAPSPSPKLSGTGAERGGPSVFLVAGIIVAVLLIGFVGFEYVQYQAGRSAPLALASPGIPTAAPATEPSSNPLAAGAVAASASPSPEADASLAVAQAAGDGLTIKLTQRSWLRVVVDGKEEMTGIFPAGTYRQFTGAKAYVRAGNAGGVDVSIAGKHVGRLGAAGDVVERTFVLQTGEEK